MYNNKRIICIIQARMQSTRLPGKVLLPLAGKPVLAHIVERLRRSKYADSIVIATTTNKADNPIIDLCNSLDCTYYRGSEDDVLTRVLEAARENKAEIIVEITADCPLCCPELIDELIEDLNWSDYISNVVTRTYPRGLDAQVFTLEALERVNKEVDNNVDRQHVSSWIYKNPKNYLRYRIRTKEYPYNFSNLRLCLDTKEDYCLLSFIFKIFPDNQFGLTNIFNLIKEHTEMFEINKHIEQKNYYKEIAEWYSQNTQL